MKTENQILEQVQPIIDEITRLQVNTLRIFLGISTAILFIVAFFC